MIDPLKASAALAVATGATAVLWRLYLAPGRYRSEGETGRLPLARSWWVIVASACTGWVAGWSTWPLVIAWMCFVPPAVTVAWIDADVRRVPNAILVRWAPIQAAAAVLVTACAHSVHPLIGAVATSAIYGVAFLVWALIARMGLGDVKLMMVIGLLVGLWGLHAAVATPLLGAVIGAAIGIGMLARGAGRKAELPFAVALASAPVIVSILTTVSTR